MGRSKSKGPKFAAVKKIITKKTINKYGTATISAHPYPLPGSSVLPPKSLISLLVLGTSRMC